MAWGSLSSSFCSCPSCLAASAELSQGSGQCPRPCPALGTPLKVQPRPPCPEKAWLSGVSRFPAASEPP